MLKQLLALSLLLALLCVTTPAQTLPASANSESGAGKLDDKPEKPARETNDNAALLEELRQMRQLIERLEARVNELENTKRSTAAPTLAASASAAVAPAPQVSQAESLTKDDRSVLDFWRGTTVNLTVDGYYGYNFNRPQSGVNLLRAYDTSSNSFSLNQASVVLEQAPDVAAGRRVGARLDLQFGQATDTVQGNGANEARPHVYRNVWQAYGTYVAPLGKGVTVDFGKFAGALGYETNYTKDNFNYSRSYFFNYLPFYHFGFRTSYNVNDKLTATHWLVNGVNQSEDFNGFKSQAVLLTYKPASRVTVQTNYYAGQEQRTNLHQAAPNGRLHVLDAYATFNVTDKLTLAVEGDYVINRVAKNGTPARVTGGVGYAKYQFTPKWALAGRFEYLSDRGGLFSGVTQALKEHTLTGEYKVADGFLLRGEYRRDFSNQRFFLTGKPGVLSPEQSTATLGLIWWFGRKQGSW